MGKIKDIEDVKEVADVLETALIDLGIEADLHTADSWTKGNYTDYMFTASNERDLWRLKTWLQDDIEKVVSPHKFEIFAPLENTTDQFSIRIMSSTKVHVSTPKEWLKSLFQQW
jgi:hypothetical protein